MPKLHEPVIATPKAGLNVRKEDGTYLPAAGDTVMHSTYWARREKDGDVKLEDLPKAAKNTPIEPAKK